jgi:hypothetical protein
MAPTIMSAILHSASSAMKTTRQEKAFAYWVDIIFKTAPGILLNDKTELKGRTVLNEEGGVNHVISIGLVNSTADSLVIEGFTIREGDIASIDGEFEFVPGVRGTHQFNVAKLPAGIYFIKASNGEIHKLVKQ